MFEPNWQPLPAIHGTHCEVLYVHVLKRYVKYLLLPYLSVDIILCAIGHGQEELQYVDSYGPGNIFITSIFLICSLCLKVSYLSSSRNIFPKIVQGVKGFICHSMCYHVAQVEKSYAHYPTIATRSLMTSILPERNLMKYSKLWWKLLLLCPLLCPAS